MTPRKKNHSRAMCLFGSKTKSGVMYIWSSSGLWNNKIGQNPMPQEKLFSFFCVRKWHPPKRTVEISMPEETASAANPQATVIYMFCFLRFISLATSAPALLYDALRCNSLSSAHNFDLRLREARTDLPKGEPGINIPGIFRFEPTRVR